MQRFSGRSSWDLDVHAATMTASHFHRSEVAMWQLDAAALTATHWGFPIGVKKGFRKQRYGYGSRVDFRASADLLRTFHGASANVVYPEMLLG